MNKKGKKPQDSAEFSLSNMFRGIGNLFELASKITDEGKEEYNRSGEVEVLGGKGKAVYGFSLKLGLGGKPVIEQFGNIKATKTGAVVAEFREPLVDVLDEGNSFLVIAELPGVQSEDISIEVKGDILELKAETKDRKYVKEALLPSPVDADSLKYSYKNGVLEIKLKKRK
jgi:HSP20 family protein